MTTRTLTLSALVLTLIVALPVAYFSTVSTDMRNFRTVTPGVLYRSGQMTERGLTRALDEYRIRTVISFRDARDSDQPPPDEFEEELCKSMGVMYHRLSPLRWSEPDGSVPATANVARFLEIVNDPATPRPILVHCFAGVHRTGAFVAIFRMACEGWSNNEAMTEMFEIGSRKSSFEADQLQFLSGFRP